MCTAGGDITQADVDDAREVALYWTGPMDDFFAARGALLPVILAPGNHGSPARHRAYAGGAAATYYVTATGPVRWIVLDSAESEIAAQVTWLHRVCVDARGGNSGRTTTVRGVQEGSARNLGGSAGSGGVVSPTASIRTAWRWTIAVVHVPPFTEFWDPSSWDSSDTLLPVLRRECDVDVVVSGHSHTYQRGRCPAAPGDARQKRCILATIGGGGGTLENSRVADTGLFSVTRHVHHTVHLRAAATALTWEAVDSKGAVFDKFELSR